MAESIYLVADQEIAVLVFGIFGRVGFSFSLLLTLLAFCMPLGWLRIASA